MESEEKRKVKRRIIFFVVLAFVVGFAIGFGVWWQLAMIYRDMEHEWDYQNFNQLCTIIR